MTLLHRKGGAPRTPAGDQNWWHPGVAGVIVRAEFFEAIPTAITGDAAGTVDIAGAASGLMYAEATAAGTVDIIGAAAGGAVSNATVDATIAVNGTSIGRIYAAGTVVATVDITGEAFGAVATGATADAVIDIAGSAEGAITVPTITGDAAGIVDVIGAAEATIFNPFSRRVTVSSRRDARGHAYWWKIEAA